MFFTILISPLFFDGAGHSLMIHNIVLMLINGIGSLGYTGIFVLMALESSIIPIPSELVMPPAGYLAQQGGMNLWLAIGAGTIGSLAGAYVNYYFAHFFGRPFVIKYGRYFLVSPDKFYRVERFFLKHGEISTFIGRLLPVVRHLISVPAGLSGMNHLRFSLYTLLGAFVWTAFLTLLGYHIGRNQDLIMAYTKRSIIWIAVVSCLMVALYVVAGRMKQESISADAESAGENPN